MYKKLHGKKLLVLGGVIKAKDIVARAQKMGAYVIVADYEIDSPAKRNADKAVLIDALDVEKIVDFCIREQVDGVTTGYVDILLPICYEVCKQLELPYYASEEMILVSTNKFEFKEMCEAHNIPVPITFDVNNKSYIQDASNLEYPVFVKPLDGSGSQGASICRNRAEFIKKYKYALEISKIKKVVVEEYLEGEEFIMDYLIIDGEPQLMSMFDRKICESRSSAVNHSNLLIGPSTELCNYVQKFDKKISKMFKEMGFDNGLIFLQGFHNDGEIIFYEMGCRLGGTFPPIIERFTGINPVDTLVHHSLTGKMFLEENAVSLKPNFEGQAAVVNFLLKDTEGKIARISGIDKITELEEVIEVVQFIEEGTKFELGKITDKPVLIVYIVAANIQELKKVIGRVYALFECVDSNNKSLLMPQYSIQDIDDKLYSKNNKNNYN